MDTKQIFGCIGAGLLLIGVFLPILEWPPNTYSFFGRGSMSGVLVLLLAVAAFALALKQQAKAVLVVAAIVSVVVLYSFFENWDTVSVINESITTLRHLGAGQGRTRPELQFGWGVLFAGIAFLFAASAGEAQAIWVRLFSASKAEK